RFLAGTLQSMGDAVITCDADERVTFMNPAAAAMTGWSGSDATGRPLGDVLQNIPATRRAIDHTAAPLTEKDGGAVFVLHDVTEALAPPIPGDERLTSLATMAGGLAHEAHPPLTVVAANLRRAVDEVRQVLGTVDASSGQRLLQVIDLLAVAQQSAER